MRVWPLALAVLAVGCGGSGSYMPLAKGNHWVYTVTTDSDTTYQDLRVTGAASVGSVRGWLLESDMGESKMGWSGGSLVASELAGTSYTPPVPLFGNDGDAWKGVVQTATSRGEASAVLHRSNESLELPGRKYRTVKCVLDLQSSQGRLQLTTWFFPGLGILRQEQRSGPALVRDRRVDFVSGP